MNKFTTQFTKQAKDSVQIREFEREKIREELCLYMEYHPRIAQGEKVGVIERTKKALVAIFTPVRAGIGALALLLLAVALPMAVEKSVPGDMLYAIKTVFNDEESEIALRSPYEQIEWDTAQLSNQLEEAQELARAGQLTEETEGEIAEAVRGHSQSARENIAKLKEENPDEAAMAELALESLFDVHTNVLLAVANTQSNEESTVEVAEPGIASSHATGTSRLAQAIEESREAVEDGMLSTPSYPTLLSRIDEEYTHAYTVFEQLTGDISTEQLEDINLRFTSIDKKIKQAIELYDAGSETEARLLLTEALLQTRKVVAYMIDLDVRNVVNIDTFIPIEFSKDDFKVELLAKHEQLQLQYEYLDEELNAKDIYTTASSSENIKELQTVPDRFASTSSLLLEGENLSKVGEVLSGIESILLKVAEEFDIEVRLLDTTQTTDEENDKEQTAEEN